MLNESSLTDAGHFASNEALKTYDLLGVPIASISMRSAIDLVSSWVPNSGRPKLVTFTNVHMLIEGHKSGSFRRALRAMDLNCPDGMPVVWFGKLKSKFVSQVCGPDFFMDFCQSNAGKGYRHFFFGGNEGVAQGVAARMKERHPDLQVAGWYTPPFRPLDADEDAEMVGMINRSGADVLWVCLGCPKQEVWLHEHRDRLNVSVILAVGQAFDLAADRTKRAPKALRRLGMEWFYRLLIEPRRLLGRYLVTNSMFLYLLVPELFRAMMPADPKPDTGR